MNLSDERMYQALVEKDASFEGIFFAAVKTTGIFCRPTCHARKPKMENVEFFRTTREAIMHGYRPCKVCSPLSVAGEIPTPFQKVISDLNENISLRLDDSDLLSRGIEPHAIRRWFKRNHGITFHAFQRMMRINAAFRKIQNGDDIASVAFDSGYESLSGFNDSYKSVIGISPGESRDKSIINVIRFETPLGPMFACATEDGICLLEFTDRKMLETELKSLNKLMKSAVVHGTNNHLENLRQQLQEYFAGERKEFNVPLVTPGTQFQKKVWKELLTIPYGTTRSYKQQAIAIGNPGGVRAVANANGMNRIAIVIPCHRVIGDDGHLTGYGGGIWRKKFLLDLEQNGSNFRAKQMEIQFEK